MDYNKTIEEINRLVFDCKKLLEEQRREHFMYDKKYD